MRNGGAVLPLSASRLQWVRVKGNKMRGRGKGGGAEEAGECGGRRTTPGEGTLQENGGAHARAEQFRQSCTASSSLDMCPD